MHIITVIPIGTGMGKDTLTYFSRTPAAPGSIVSIPVRSRSSYGLVVDSRDASENKAEIKTLSFSMKKIGQIVSPGFLSDRYIQSVHAIADYYATTAGAVLSAMVPAPAIMSASHLSYIATDKEQVDSTDSFHETLIFQTNEDDRYASYKSFIREEFAKGKSVFFCLPTVEDVLNSAHILRKGIEPYTYVLHGAMSKKEITSVWRKVLDEPHPVIIVATGSFMSLPRADIGTIVVEKESSRAYAMPSRPYIDMRTAARIIARVFGIRVMLGDDLLRVETLWKEKNGEYGQFAPPVFRSFSSARCELVPMYEAKDFNKKKFSLFSKQLTLVLTEAQKKGERTFLFCGRKGLSPTTVCSDCGTVVACKECGSPVVLYGKKGSSNNIFVCHHCGAERPADTVCAYCKGWRLTTLGIGIDRVADEIQEMYPDSAVVVMDRDHISTHGQAVKARDMFYKTPGAICVGTEMALPYLNRSIEHSAVVSLDALFAVPDFRIHEKIMHILLDIRRISERSNIVQTRQKNTDIFDYALKGNLIDFYRSEIEERKQIGYPPFRRYVKLSMQGEKKAMRQKMEEIARRFSSYEVSVFDAFSVGKKHTVHAMIILPETQTGHREEAIDAELLTALRSLPPSVAVRIDPDTFL